MQIVKILKIGQFLVERDPPPEMGFEVQKIHHRRNSLDKFHFFDTIPNAGKQGMLILTKTLREGVELDDGGKVKPEIQLRHSYAWNKADSPRLTSHSRQTTAHNSGTRAMVGRSQ